MYITQVKGQEMKCMVHEQLTVKYYYLDDKFYNKHQKYDT